MDLQDLLDQHGLVLDPVSRELIDEDSDESIINCNGMSEKEIKDYIIKNIAQ